MPVGGPLTTVFSVLAAVATGVLACVALVTFDYLRNSVSAVEAVRVDVVAHLCEFFQMAATLLNLVNLLIVEQNSKNSLK